MLSPPSTSVTIFSLSGVTASTTKAPAASSVNSSASGRTPRTHSCPFAASTAPGTRSNRAPPTFAKAPCSSDAGLAGTRLMVGSPNWRATSTLAGPNQISSGVPTWTKRPSSMTAMRSPSAIASR